MDSSTSHHASSDRGRVAAIIAVLIGAPLLALMLLQTNYTLAYWACADRSNAWLHTPNAIGGGAAVLLAMLGWRTARRVRGDALHGFLGTVALLMVMMVLILVVAFTIPPLLLHPCDV
jgi:hypothetical protein